MIANENIFRHGFCNQQDEGLQEHKLLISIAPFVKDNSYLFQLMIPVINLNVI